MARPKSDPMERVLDELSNMTPQQRADWLTFVTRWVKHLDREATRKPNGDATLRLTE